MLLFFLKTKSAAKNEEVNQENKIVQNEGLTYRTEILGNLVNKDTDGDGIPDWEEGLWGTDPGKRDTNDDGVPDNIAIENLKKQQGQNESPDIAVIDEKNLTETDKFSREFFATVAALNQAGAMDEETVEKLSSSLAENIQNSEPRKVFTVSDLKIIDNETSSIIIEYDKALDNIHKKYPVENSVIDILQRFIVDENNVDSSILVELDPIIGQMNKIISELATINVPESFSSLHLEFINGFERVSENLSDIQLYDGDAIVALTGISQYNQNAETLETAVANLGKAMDQKLNN